MAEGIPTHTINLDISTAFDAPDVKLLVHKFKIMGLNSQIINWIRSYLSDRRQMVKLKDAISEPIEVTSGTGQGCPLGSTLFAMYIIDLPKQQISCKLDSFADDTRLWKHITCLNDCRSLQNDLNTVVKYFERNKLQLNVRKTKFIIYHRGRTIYEFDYSIDGEIIERVKIIRDLGILPDEKMNFGAHIEYICSKAKSVFAWIRHFGKEFEDPWTIKALYFSFVVPIVEYASQIWCPYTAEKKNKS